MLSAQTCPAEQSVCREQFGRASLSVRQYVVADSRYGTRPQLRKVMSTRWHSTLVVQGTRHTPPTQSEPGPHGCVASQKGRGRVSVRHTPSSVQYSLAAQVPDEPAVQPVKQAPLRQRRPAPHEASVVQAGPVGVVGRQYCTAPAVAHSCPLGQGFIVSQRARHWLFTHARPVPHCVSKRQVSCCAVQRPPTQRVPPAHCASAVHAGIETVWQAPPTHTPLAPHWALLVQPPGTGVGSVSVGARQRPEVAAPASEPPRQAQPGEQSPSREQRVTQPAVVQNDPAGQAESPAHVGRDAGGVAARHPTPSQKKHPVGVQRYSSPAQPDMPRAAEPRAAIAANRAARVLRVRVDVAGRVRCCMVFARVPGWVLCIEKVEIAPSA